MIGAGQSFFEDEATTVVAFVRGGPSDIFLGELELNNHVLFSFAAWLTSSLSDESEAMYRLPSIVAALAAVGVVGVWSWRRLGPPVAVAVVVLFTVSPTHLVFGTLARGYGMTFLASALLLVVADRLHDSPTTRDVGVFCVIAGLGVLAHALFAFAVAAHVLVLLTRKPLRARLLVGMGAAALVCLAVYGPMLLRGGGDEAAAVGVGFEDEEDTLRWYGVATAPFNAHVRDALDSFLVSSESGGLSLQSKALFGAFLALSALAVVRLRRTGEGWLGPHLVVPIAVLFGTLAALGSLAPARFSSFLLPHLLLLVALGAVEVLDAVGRWRLVHVALVALVAIGTVVALTRTVRLADRQAAVPRQNLRGVGDVVRWSGIDEVVSSRGGSRFRYYLPGDVEELTNEELERRSCEGDAPLAVLLRTDVEDRADTSCLEQRGALRLEMPQRARIRWEVWLIGAPTPTGRS